jgi:hypothetical protein
MKDQHDAELIEAGLGGLFSRWGPKAPVGNGDGIGWGLVWRGETRWGRVRRGETVQGRMPAVGAVSDEVLAG